MYERAFQSWFARQLELDSPGLRRALARLAWREEWDSGPAVEQLKMAGRKLIEWRDFTALWRPQPLDRDAAIRGLLDQARALWTMAASCMRTGDGLVGFLRPLREMLGWIERGRVTDLDTLEAVLLKAGRDLNKSQFRKGRGFFSDEYTRESVVVAECLPVGREAVPGGRSETVNLQIPPRRCRTLPERRGSDGEARRRACVSNRELPLAAVHKTVCQCGVCRRDDGTTGCSASRILSA